RWTTPTSHGRRRSAALEIGEATSGGSWTTVGTTSDTSFTVDGKRPYDQRSPDASSKPGRMRPEGNHARSNSITRRELGAVTMPGSCEPTTEPRGGSRKVDRVAGRRP